MLSEHHDISHEFPEYRRMLDALRAKDAQFDALVAKHDYIDDEIRQLEERQSPISISSNPVHCIEPMGAICSSTR